ncbi:MAG TPA: transposase [Eubacteriaceae bacterium]|nr:transposase [Eubacteriaceae bacterium]
MGRKNKFTYETKLSAVTEFLEGRGSCKEIAEKFEMGERTLRNLHKMYLVQGPGALMPSHKNQQYTAEFKTKVVQEYLEGAIGYEDLALKHGIKSTWQIRNWIILYNDGKSLKSYKSGGDTIMNKGRKTTYDERIKIVEDCLQSGLDYNATAEKYKVSYQQVYSWVRKYQSQGVPSLQDGRGKPKDQNKMDEVERLKAENQLLKAQLERMRVEDMLKKKVHELRMGLDITSKKKK